MNARGLADPVKRRDVFEWLKEQNLSIVCLQDVHFKKSNLKMYEDEWGSQCEINAYTSESRGVAIMFRKGLDCKTEVVHRDETGNLLIVKIKIEHMEIILITLYGPNKDNPVFYDSLRQKVSQYSDLPLVFCGDWNLVMNHDIDTRGYVRENNKKSRQSVGQMIECFELVDVWRASNPEKLEFSWQSTKIRRQQARLDFFLVSKDIQAITKRCAIGDRYRSDHKLIIMEIDKQNWKRGKGFWKLNTGLLSDSNYINLVKHTIAETAEKYSKKPAGKDNSKKEYTVDDQTLWEMIKLEVRGQTIQYSSRNKRKERETETRLTEEIRILEDRLKQEVNMIEYDNINERLEKIRGELENIRLPRIKAIMLRARAQFYEEGEKPSNFFCNLEKRNYLNKLITNLRVDERVIDDPAEILKEQKNYYESLYSSKQGPDPDRYIDHFLADQNLRVLSKEQRERCEGMIKESEVKQVIKGMKNGKTPGSDGFPIEFYKVFWLDIGEYLLRSLNKAYDRGEVSLTQKQGIITCIPKSDERELLKNWRPITLLNIDYKILSGVLSHRLRGILMDIISTDQKGFLPERFIGENTRLVYDIMHYLSNVKQKGLIMLIDFEKAFDSLEWKYIERVLDKYKFGSQFKRWCRVLYADSQSCVINGGHFSPFFKLGRGCRQGDPLSPYIFILAVEPLAMAIKNNKNIKGIEVKGIEHVLGQYADDTFILLDGSESSLNETLSLLDMFHYCSGLKTNA